MKPFLIFVCALAAWAGTPYDTSIKPAVAAREISINEGSAALWQSLKKLETRASMIMITARPGDEDGGMLTYESRGNGARVALLTLDRGEGGPNLMSPDCFDPLGLVRTEELLAAGRYYGVDQYFTRVVDYGVSKTMADSIRRWTRDRVLADMVRVIRMTRPLVVTSVFVGEPSDGDGGNQAAGAMARAAYAAAADPKMFPEQIRAGLRPWAALKDYARVPFRPTTAARRAAGAAELSINLEVPEGTYDPVLGASYLQIASAGLGYEKSQNGGPGIPVAGQAAIAYHRYESRVDAQPTEKDFFDGINTTLMGMVDLARGGDTAFVLTGLRRINAAVQSARLNFSASEPQRCATALAAGMRETIALIGEIEKSGLTDDSKYDLLHELSIKKAQFNAALAESLGLAISAAVAPDGHADPGIAESTGDPETFRMAIPGQKFGVRVRVVDQGTRPVQLVKVSLESQDGSAWNAQGAARPGEIGADKPVDVAFTTQVPGDAPFTRPYFSRPDAGQSYYDIQDERWLTLPLAPYPLAAWADLSYDGAPIRIGQVVQTVRRERGLGAVLQPLAVGPAIGVEISPGRGAAAPDAKSFEVLAVVRSNVKGAANGAVRLDLPAGWKSEPESSPFVTAHDGDDRSLTFRVTPAGPAEKPYHIAAVAEYGGRQYREGYTIAGYAGLRPYFLYKPAVYRAQGADETPKK